MFYRNFLHPPVLAKYNEQGGHRKVVTYIDRKDCDIHGKRRTKQVNGTNGNVPLSKEHLNGNGELYGRTHGEGDAKGLQEGLYDAVK
ncbi:hypothetical protein HHI36_019016, partial [Cryptolaemus montrouzieri]